MASLRSEGPETGPASSVPIRSHATAELWLPQSGPPLFMAPNLSATAHRSPPRPLVNCSAPCCWLGRETRSASARSWGFRRWRWIQPTPCLRVRSRTPASDRWATKTTDCGAFVERLSGVLRVDSHVPTVPIGIGTSECFGTSRKTFSRGEPVASPDQLNCLGPKGSRAPSVVSLRENGRAYDTRGPHCTPRPTRWT